MKKFLICCLTFSLGIALTGQKNSILTDLEYIVELEKAQHHQILNLKTNPLTKDYDLKYHRLEWEVDPAVHYISGTVTSYFIPTTVDFNQINFDLAENMTVASVLYHDSPLSFALSNDNLQITLPTTITVGTLDSLSIAYEGAPIETGFVAFATSTHDEVPVMWTLSEPYGAKTWWPCKQDLNDKIDSVDIIVTTPEQYRVGSNGVLVSEETTDTGFKTYHWKHRYPIPAYLISLAITNYISVEEYVQTDHGDSILILNYIYPEEMPLVQANLSYIIEQMEFYNELFGLYPFASEKYGHAQMGWGGGMEHQTMSSMGGFSYTLQAHELAHQWFGDKVTCGSWQDIWLNEGFATYLTALTFEFLTPDPEDWNNWKNWSIDVVTDQPGGSTWVDDTSDVSRIFDYRLSYQKGALILHMLRWVLGDEAFFQGARAYLNDPQLAYAYARTDDLKHHFETVSGIDLTEFLDDWYYGQGFPSYSILYAPKSDGIEISISQSTSTPLVDFFEMPVPIKLSDGVNDTLLVLNHTFSGQIFDVYLPFEPSMLEFDPDKWILSQNNTVDLGTNTHDLEIIGSSIMLYPNPLSNTIYITIDNPVHRDKIEALIITDTKGAIIWKTKKIQSRTEIDLSKYPAGTYIVTFLSNEGSIVKRVTKI